MIHIHSSTKLGILTHFPSPKLADKIPTAVLHQKLDLDEITAVLRTRRLRWYGHIQRATFMHQLHHAIGASRHQTAWEAKEDVVRMCEK